MENKLKHAKKKIFTEKEIDISTSECTFDTSEEKPGISYEIIGTPGSKNNNDD